MSRAEFVTFQSLRLLWQPGNKDSTLTGALRYALHGAMDAEMELMKVAGLLSFRTPAGITGAGASPTSSGHIPPSSSESHPSSPKARWHQCGLAPFEPWWHVTVECTTVGVSPSDGGQRSTAYAETQISDELLCKSWLSESLGRAWNNRVQRGSDRRVRYSTRDDMRKISLWKMQKVLLKEVNIDFNFLITMNDWQMVCFWKYFSKKL